ncbi:cyanobactin biosynthesis PatC/TenC/TruC family protein [Streptomyces sp. NBRC 110611]|uniref:cyanobactin biosynthesis PatC/TenC/TruC family protein n=1 Tax=Streptomyces sp. NBRC 110611 TaxID=1621259 RepID=UPI0037D9AA71
MSEAGRAALVRVGGPYVLQTGLSDYAMWSEMFADATAGEADPRSYRRGRIWA